MMLNGYCFFSRLWKKGLNRKPLVRLGSFKFVRRSTNQMLVRVRF